MVNLSPRADGPKSNISAYFGALARRSRQGQLTDGPRGRNNIFTCHLAAYEKTQMFGEGAEGTRNDLKPHG